MKAALLKTMELHYWLTNMTIAFSVGEIAERFPVNVSVIYMSAHFPCNYPPILDSPSVQIVACIRYRKRSQTNDISLAKFKTVVNNYPLQRPLAGFTCLLLFPSCLGEYVW